MNDSGALLTYEEVARDLQTSVRSVRRLVQLKKLRLVDLGHRTKRGRPVDLARCKARLAGDTMEVRL